MDFTAAYKSRNNPEQILPPKRGQVKRKIFNQIFKSAVTAVSIARAPSGRLSLSSASSTPDGNLSGFNTDDHPDA